MSKIGFVRNFQDGSWGHIVSSGGKNQPYELSIAIRIKEIYVKIVSGEVPDKEFTERELTETNSEREVHKSEKIIEILHSISKVKVDGDLEVWFNQDEDPEAITSFIPGSFTRELLELIEKHLVEGSCK